MGFLKAFYWSVTVTTSVGKDIIPETILETYFTITSIILGVLIYAFIIGSASSALSNIDSVEMERKAKLESITNFMRQRRVPAELQKRIRDYYDYMWTRQLNNQNDTLFAELHSGLRLELSIALNRKLVQRVPMFRECSPDCLVALIEKLKSRIYLPRVCYAL